MFQYGSTNGWTSTIFASEITEPFQEADLVRQAQLGDHGAFSSLFARYQQQICKYLLRLVNNPEVAYDLAQDTFLAAWQALSLMPAQMHFRPWLYKIATNKAVSWWRRDKQINWLLWDKQESTSFAPTDIEEQVALTDLVQQVLCTLPEVQRACLLLQGIGGFKIHEIAQILNHYPTSPCVCSIFRKHNTSQNSINVLSYGKIRWRNQSPVLLCKERKPCQNNLSLLIQSHRMLSNMANFNSL